MKTSIKFSKIKIIPNALSPSIAQRPNWHSPAPLTVITGPKTWDPCLDCLHLTWLSPCPVYSHSLRVVYLTSTLSHPYLLRIPNSNPISYPFSRNERAGHDVADVLLSLKHAVLKPSHESSSQQLSHYNGSSGGAMGSTGAGPHQASLSYTVHHPHHQMLVSSANHHHHQYPSSSMANYYDTSGQYAAPVPPPPPSSMYPSMSVNVSMNMTMHHGYGADSGLQCSQVRTNLFVLLWRYTITY